MAKTKKHSSKDALVPGNLKKKGTGVYIKKTVTDRKTGKRTQLSGVPMKRK